MDRNYMEFNTTFPAMTVCQCDVYNTTKADHYIKKHWGNVNQEKRIYYEDFLLTISNISYDHLTLFQKFLNDDTIPQGGYYGILREISNNFPGLYEGIPTRVGLEMIDRGLCYTINSAFVNYVHDRRTSQFRGNQSSEVLVPAYQMGYDHGVAWIMVTRLMNITHFYVHSPFEFSDVTERELLALPNHIHQTTYKALELVATPALRTLNVAQRRCRFPDESNLDISGSYSYTLCRTQCRIRLATRLCHCSPYFYPLIDNLHFVTDPVTSKADQSCQCMTPCNVVAYTATKSSTATWNENSQFLWQIVRSPRIQLQRSVLYGPIDLLVSFGGTVGFFLGCSLLSGVEVVYFYTLRLMWYVIRAGKKTPRLTTSSR